MILKTEDPVFWQNQTDTHKILKEKEGLKRLLSRFEELEKFEEELVAFKELIEETQDLSLIKEFEVKLEKGIKEASEFKLLLLFKDPFDQNSVYLSIHAGSGGVDAQDWAELLAHMYVLWSEKRGFTVKTIDLSPGEEAGIKSITYHIKGDYAYGYLKGEAGVHRLVRISPYDTNKKRHTSFALVEITPEIEEVNYEIDDKDLRIDTFRASGKGGQHLQKTDSAVRIVHLPTGLVVSCQNERSQHLNKATALKVLYSRLFQKREDEKKEELKIIKGEHKSASWGNQIRSYVFQPYQLVKDHRTNTETGNVEAVMRGEIEIFIEAFLKNYANLPSCN